MKVTLVTVSQNEHASHRYRTKVCQEALLTSGTECRIAPHFQLDAQIACYMSKHFSYSHRSDVLGAKGMGQHILFDISDDHSETKHADFTRFMVEQADVITCNSDEMRRRVMATYQRAATVIPDPILLPPNDRDPDLSKWLWVGHMTNIVPLEDMLPALDGRDLEIMTYPSRHVQRNGPTRVSEWSVETQPHAYARNGVVVVPYGDGRQEAKSANRILEALNASCVVVVPTMIPAAEELAPFVERYPADVGEHSIAKMRAGREYARRKYSKEAIGKMWRKACLG